MSNHGWLIAGGWGLAAGAALVLGALLAMAVELPHRLIAAVMGFTKVLDDPVAVIALDFDPPDASAAPATQRPRSACLRLALVSEATSANDQLNSRRAAGVPAARSRPSRAA